MIIQVEQLPLTRGAFNVCPALAVLDELQHEVPGILGNQAKVLWWTHMCSLKDLLPQLLKCCWQTIKWSTILVYLVFFSANIRTVLIWAGWSPYKIVFNYQNLQRLSQLQRATYYTVMSLLSMAHIQWLLFEGIWEAWHLSSSSHMVSLWGRLRLSLTRISLS